MNPIFVFLAKQCIQLMFQFEKFKNRRKSTYYSSENFSILTKSWISFRTQLSLPELDGDYENVNYSDQLSTLEEEIGIFLFFSIKKYATSHQLLSIRQKDPKDCYQCFPFVKVLFFYQQSQPGSLVSVSFPRGHHDRPGRGLSPGGIWGWRVRWAWLILQALWLYCLTIKRSDLLERFFDTSRMCKDSVWPSQLPTTVSDLRSGFPVPYGRKTVGFFPHRGRH